MSDDTQKFPDKMVSDMRALERAGKVRMLDFPARTVRWMKLHPEAVIPKKETPGAAGADIRAFLTGDSKVKIACGTNEAVTERGPDTSEDVPFISLLPGQRAIIPTGLKVAVPEGYEMQVRPRSGASFKKGLTISNAPGTVDSDYRGEVGIIVANTTTVRMNIQHGERIAQVVYAQVARLTEVEVEDLDATERGEGGFGSTGSQ